MARYLWLDVSVTSTPISKSSVEASLASLVVLMFKVELDVPRNIVYSNGVAQDVYINTRCDAITHLVAANAIGCARWLLYVKMTGNE